MDGSRGLLLIRGMVYRPVVLDRLTGIRGRYNMSYILRQGALNGKPVLGVSINYRVAAFGFLDSEEVRVCIYQYKWSRLC